MIDLGPVHLDIGHLSHQKRIRIPLEIILLGLLGMAALGIGALVNRCPPAEDVRQFKIAPPEGGTK